MFLYINQSLYYRTWIKIQVGIQDINGFIEKSMEFYYFRLDWPHESSKLKLLEAYEENL